MAPDQQLLPEKVVKSIEKDLLNKSIQVDWSSLKKPDTQGFMNLMTTVESSAGLLVIHYNSNPLEEQRRVDMPNKISSVTLYLKEKLPHLPIQETFASEKLSNDAYYVVQKFLPGNPLGKRDVKEGEITDTYNVSENEAPVLQNEVDNFTAEIHMLPVSNFGFLIKAKNGTPQGEYESWEKFLKEGCKKWCKELKDVAILESDQITKKRVEKIQSKIDSLLESNKELLHLPQGYFVHGDIVNLSNILVQDAHVSGIIDFEWSLSGDPAWDFTHTEARPTEPYYKKRGMIQPEEREEFLRAIDFNTVFWSLWGSHLHARINNYGIKEILLDRAELYLRKFKK